MLALPEISLYCRADDLIENEHSDVLQQGGEEHLFLLDKLHFGRHVRAAVAAKMLRRQYFR